MRLLTLLLFSVVIYLPAHAVGFVPEHEPVPDNPKVTFRQMPYKYDHDLKCWVFGSTLAEVEEAKQERKAQKKRTSKEKYRDECRDILTSSCCGGLYGAGIMSLFHCQGMVSSKGIIYAALASGLGSGVWKFCQIRANSECAIESQVEDRDEDLENSAQEEN